MIKVASIKPNDFSFIENTTKDAISASIEEYLKVEEIEKEKMMEFIVDSIGITPEDFGDTIVCRENDKYIYQVCYLSHKKTKANDDPINAMATYMTLTRQKVHGSAVLICSNINENGVCQHGSVSKETIVDILYRRINHTGLKVTANDEIVEYNYGTDPLLNLTDNERANYQFIEAPILKFNIIVGIEKNPVNNKVNKMGTKFLGKHRVNGDIFVLSRVDEQDYDSIDKETFLKILKVCSKHLGSRDLTESEKNDEKIDNLPVMKNKYIILNKRYSNHQERCHLCRKKLEGTSYVTCNGCYRVYYDTEKCRLDDWEYHKDECLFKKAEINISLQKNN